MVSTKQVLRVSKYIVPNPSKGIATGIILPAGILLGGYIFLTRVLGITAITELLKNLSPIYDSQKAVADSLGLPAPDPVLGQWGNMWNDLANFFAPGIYIALTALSAIRGESVSIAASGMKPNTGFTYGWRPFGSWPGYTEQFTSNAKGDWFGPSGIIIDFATPVGTHTIYLDQRPQGGGYGEIKFTVLAGGF